MPAARPARLSASRFCKPEPNLGSLPTGGPPVKGVEESKAQKSNQNPGLLSPPFKNQPFRGRPGAQSAVFANICPALKTVGLPGFRIKMHPRPPRHYRRQTRKPLCRRRLERFPRPGKSRRRSGHPFPGSPPLELAARGPSWSISGFLDAIPPPFRYRPTASHRQRQKPAISGLASTEAQPSYRLNEQPTCQRGVFK